VRPLLQRRAKRGDRLLQPRRSACSRIRVNAPVGPISKTKIEHLATALTARRFVPAGNNLDGQKSVRRTDNRQF